MTEVIQRVKSYCTKSLNFFSARKGYLYDVQNSDDDGRYKSEAWKFRFVGVRVFLARLCPVLGFKGAGDWHE